MRKQTKLVAVLSTAALLAIGASMTSFAAQGWAEEDGTWVYYNKDGEKATEEWKRSGDNWFWLDDNGEMAIDQLIEDDDNYYYVNESGAMVANQWVAIENEDAGEEDEPEAYWYYFQANGKAYKRSDNASDDVIAAKTINGKKYAFDTEGRMLYGWVDGGERQTDDDAWMTCKYYFGDENDGAMSLGWRQISIVDDNNAEMQQPGDEFWDEDQDRWFYFQSSGKKVQADTADADALKTKTINGRKYGFDGYGRMIGDWFVEGTKSEAGKGQTWVDSNGVTHIATQGNADYSSSFMYFSDPEDGARVTKGWFKVVPGYYLHEDKYNDGDDYWYYADGDGNLYANEIKSIKGKKYAFDNYGRMMDGLVFVRMDTKTNGQGFDSKNIAEKYADDGDIPYDTGDNFDDFVIAKAHEIGTGEIRCFYFGDADDGAMKTGKQTVEIDGEDFSFKFEDSSSKKGAGIVGKDDEKLYMAGKLVEADKDDKYKTVLYVELKNGSVYMDKIDTDDLFGTFLTSGTYNAAKEETTYDAESTAVQKTAAVNWFNNAFVEADIDTIKLYVVNSSGSMVKNKSAAKDGEDYKFDVDNYEIKKVVYEEN